MRRKLIAILLGLSLALGGVFAPLFFDSADATRLTLNKYIGDPSLNGFRLTLTSGTAVTTADVTGATTVYLTPYRGDEIVLWDGTNWQLYQSAEVSLAVGTLANASNYDVWCRDVNGTLTLDFSAAWTNDTTRSQAIATTNGVTHKSGDQTRRLAGTIRTTSTTTTEDSAAKRFCANQDNRVRRAMSRLENGGWTYTTATVRQANASALNQLAYVGCDATTSVDATVTVMLSNTQGNVSGAVGIGVDSTTVASGIAQLSATPSGSCRWALYGHYAGNPGLGYHYLSWLEWSGGAGTHTWEGTASGTILQSGIIGTVWN